MKCILKHIEVYRSTIEMNQFEINRLFILSFEDRTHRTSYKQYFLPNVKIKDWDIMIEALNIFYQSVKNDLRTYDNIQTIATDYGYD